MHANFGHHFQIYKCSVFKIYIKQQKELIVKFFRHFLANIYHISSFASPTALMRWIIWRILLKRLKLSPETLLLRYEN